MTKQYGSDPATIAFPITPSDSNNLTQVVRGLYVGTSGNIAVDMLDSGTNVIFMSVPVGPLPIRVKKIYATGTTANNIVGLL